MDENGNRKTFERFLNDVREIDETYNSNYLRAEFTFVQASAEMAAKWERFMQDGDRYYLQYRTAGDARYVPPMQKWPASHSRLQTRSGQNSILLTDGAAAVPWSRYANPSIRLQTTKRPWQGGKSALEVDKKGMFRFNAGMEQKTMPDYNPYTIKRCKDCDMNNGNMKLVFVPENELCAACKLVRTLANADAKQIKKQAKPLQGTVITNNEFPFPVNISKRTLQEWTNQPYKFYHEKNLMLLDIKNVFAKAKYLGTADNHKGIPHLIQSHIFEIEVRGEKALIIVREYDWHEYTLHSLSEGGELYKHIKKERIAKDASSGNYNPVLNI